MRFFRDTSIRIKVLVPPAVLILALALVSLLAIRGMNRQRAVLSEINDIALERVTLIDELIALSERVQADVFHISVLRFMNLPEEDVQPLHERLEQGLNDLDVVYGQILARWPLDETERSILDRMKRPMDDFTRQAEEAAVVVSDNPSFGVLLVRSSAVPFAEFRKTLTEFLRYQKAKVARAETESSQRTTALHLAIVVIGLPIAVTGVFAAVLISTRWISRPIRSITDLMGRLARGDLTIEVGDLDRRDEIGDMASALGVFLDSAIERARAEQALRESEQRFRHLVNNMSSGVAVYDAIDDGSDFIIADLNQAGERISQVQRDQVVGKSVLKAFPGVMDFGLFDVFQEV